MSRIETELIVKAIAEGFEQVAGEMGKLNDEQEKGAQVNKTAAGSWTEFKSQLDIALGVIQKVGEAAKWAYGQIKEGAELQLAQTRFDRLAKSIGTTGDALLNDLGPATAGLMSNAENIALAGDLMSLGLAKTHDEAVRLSGVAGQLGMDMNQLVLTLTNQTTMRFDSLGVAVDGFDDKVKALEASGMSADEAFKWAFIEQAESQIERVGGMAETSAGQIKILESNVKNLADKFKILGAEAAMPVVSMFNEQYDALVLMTKAYRMGEISLIEYEVANALLLSSFVDGDVIVEQWTSRLDEAEQGLNRAGKATLDLSFAQKEFTKGSQDISDAVGETADMMDFYGDRAQEAANRTKYMGTQMRRAAVDAGIAEKSLGGFLDGINVNIDSPVKAFIEDMEWFLATGGKFEEAFEKIKNADVDPNIKLESSEQLLDLINQAQDAIASGDDDSLTGALEELDNLTFEIDSLDEVNDITQDVLNRLRQMSSGTWDINVTYNEGYKQGGDTGDPGGTGNTGGETGFGDYAIAGGGTTIVNVNGSVAWEMEKRMMRRSDRARLESVM